jgi:hypothetical protein
MPKRSSSTQLTPPPAARPKLATIWEFAETDATNIVNGVTSLKFEIKSDQPMGIVVVSETVRHDNQRVFPETGRSSFGFVGVIKSASARVYDGKIKIDLCLCGWDSKAGQSVAFFRRQIDALDSLLDQLLIFDEKQVFPMTAVDVGSATITTRLTIDPSAANPRGFDFVSQDSDVNVPDSASLFVDQVLKPGALVTVHACPIFWTASGKSGCTLKATRLVVPATPAPSLWSPPTFKF